MPSHVKIIQAHEFIKATPEGDLDFDATKKLFIDIASTSKTGPLDDYEIILDTRKAHSFLTVTDLYNLVSEFDKFPAAFSRKMAIISPPERYVEKEFFALCAQNRGFPVKAFVSFSDALEWLLEDTDALSNKESGQASTEISSN